MKLGALISIISMRTFVAADTRSAGPAASGHSSAIPRGGGGPGRLCMHRGEPGVCAAASHAAFGTLGSVQSPTARDGTQVLLGPLVGMHTYVSKQHAIMHCLWVMLPLLVTSHMRVVALQPQCGPAPPPSSG